MFRENLKHFHTLSFLLALNFFRHSTVSCLCIMEATVERCCGETEKEMLKIKHLEEEPWQWQVYVGRSCRRDLLPWNVLILRLFRWRHFLAKTPELNLFNLALWRLAIIPSMQWSCSMMGHMKPSRSVLLCKVAEEVFWSFTWVKVALHEYCSFPGDVGKYFQMSKLQLTFIS